MRCRGRRSPSSRRRPQPAPLRLLRRPRARPFTGVPRREGAARLAPIAPPPIPTAADKLPVAKLKAPPGFKVEVFAAGVGNARSLRIGDKGTVFVGSRLLDKVYALTEKDGKREVKVIASGLHRPNGLAYHKGALYVAELSKVWRYDAIEDHLDSPPKPTLVNDNFPKDEPHGWKFIAIGPGRQALCARSARRATSTTRTRRPTPISAA